MTICRFPFVCVSIGLTIGKVPTVGVVYNPIIDEVRTKNHIVLKTGYYLDTSPDCMLVHVFG